MKLLHISEDVATVLGLIVFVALLASIIFYVLSLQKALQTVSPENRKMPPGRVWLLMIPVFNWVWNFFVANAIAVSFEKEYKKYGLFQPKPTYDLGLSLAILHCCIIMPVFNFYTAPASLVVWIFYWVKVNEHKKQLLNVARNIKLKDGGIPIVE